MKWSNEDVTVNRAHQQDLLWCNNIVWATWCLIRIYYYGNSVHLFTLSRSCWRVACRTVRWCLNKLTWHILSMFSSVGMTKYTAGTSGIGSRSECRSLWDGRSQKITKLSSVKVKHEWRTTAKKHKDTLAIHLFQQLETLSFVSSQNRWPSKKKEKRNRI